MVLKSSSGWQHNDQEGVNQNSQEVLSEPKIFHAGLVTPSRVAFADGNQTGQEMSMKNCRFCGGNIRQGVETCPHCGKTLSKKKVDADESVGLTDLESWKKKTVPSWVMLLLVGAALFCVWIMFAQGCEKGMPEQTPQESSNLIVPASFIEIHLERRA